MKNFQVVIIGGGPAGAAATLYFKRETISVALVDKAFFREINPVAMEFL